MKLLHIIASPRAEHSRTLMISKEFIKNLEAKIPHLEINELDLFKTNLPDVYGGAVDAKYSLMTGSSLDETSRSAWDEIAGYASDFLNFDIYLITCPMWNFTIPYKLKHYIDVIMQAGILFNFTQNGVEGLAKNKRMICITSRGSDYSENTHMHQFDYQEPYLRSIFGFSGIRDISFINAQPMDYGPEITQQSMNNAFDEVKKLVQQMTS